MTITKELLAKYVPHSNIFVETGTFKGHTTQKAIELGFKKVYTCELQERLYNVSKERLKEEIEKNNVELFLCSSVDFLNKIMPTIKEPAGIFLDAHIDGGNKTSETPNVHPCPLYEELSAIDKSPIKEHTIIVDDLRLLGKSGWGSTVNVNTIISMAKKINDKYEAIEEGDQLIFRIRK